MTARWLAIVGIGEDGRDGLSASACSLVDTAELLVGGPRHLALAGDVKGEKLAWLNPLEATVTPIAARRGRPVCVLASGDPFWFGAGVTLARHFSADETIVVPAPSAFSLTAARLGWTIQDTVTLGLNSRALEQIVPHLHAGARIIALSLNAETPGKIAKLVASHGFGSSRVTVLECLGGPRERIRSAEAQTFNVDAVDPLNTIAIEVVAGANARFIPRCGGLPDSYFENDGQLTKREIRAITLSSLQPCPGHLLWDVGLGAGSVAIEWLLAHSSTQAIGFERDAVRAARAARNAVSLGVPRLQVRHQELPSSLPDAPPPDAVFIGGGVAHAGLAAMCWVALKPGGRLVANAVTLEGEAELLRLYGVHGGTLTRLSIDRAESVGSKHGWRPAMPVVQWVAVKPDVKP